MESRPLTVEELYARCEELGLEPRWLKSGQGFHCHCPVHGDEKNRHLYIHQGYKHECVCYCHHGCPFPEIAQALHIQKDALSPRSRIASGLEQRYQYHNPRGHVIFEEVRTYHGERKSVYSRRPDPAHPGQWINNLDGIPSYPLYRLPQLLKADPKKLVLLAEGPKCAELLAESGYPATALAGGAGKWHLTDFITPLIGRRVAIFPDYDEAGVEHAREIAKRLRSAGIQAGIVQIPGYRMTQDHGKDIYDWVKKDGHPLEAAIGLAEAAVRPRLVELTLQRQVELTDQELTPPPLAPEVYLGLTGQVMQAVAPAVESGMAALLVNWLVSAGIYVGRGPHAIVAATRHYPNLFAATVGNTGAGKGASWGPIQHLMNLIDAGFYKLVQGGLSSGEGLVHLVRDPVVVREQVKSRGRWTEEFTERLADEGVEDKRCLILEEEFASLLTVMTRQGNTISPRLREAWDSGRLQIATKSQPLTATNAHIGLMVHVTPDELRRKLSATDAANGFANRFLWVHTAREQYLPEGGKLPNMNRLVQDARAAFERARFIGEVQRDLRARKLWNHLYRQITTYDAGMVGDVTARARAQLLRLSLIYAVLDGSHFVTTDHLMAAFGVWDYCLASARYLWGGKIGDPLADQIYATIAIQRDGITRTQLVEAVGKHLKSTDLQAALMSLFREKKITSRRAIGEGGREVEIFEKAEEEKSAGTLVARGRELLEQIDDLPLEPPSGNGHLNAEEN